MGSLWRMAELIGKSIIGSEPGDEGLSLLAAALGTIGDSAATATLTKLAASPVHESTRLRRMAVASLSRVRSDAWIPSVVINYPSADLHERLLILKALLKVREPREVETLISEVMETQTPHATP